MSALFKYVIVPSSVLATGFYAYWSLNDGTFLSLYGDVFQSVYREIAAIVPARPEAAAADIGEELDYLVARRLGSLAGWSAFLAAHGSGVHAESARAELDVLLAE